jgi:SAM-dependent MidA family methyltransferase
MSLKSRLEAEIAGGGPIGVADYMFRCLHDPRDGYYATRPAIGAAGDFVTAPQVSQMFGELIGLWLIEAWRARGEPSPAILAEAGPGDGTLMSDIARVARRSDAFLAACEVWLVEASAPLRALQAGRISGFPMAPHWAQSLAEIPERAPLLFIANEFLDCLPARQFQRTAEGWAERVVGLDDAGALAFGLRPLAADSAFPDAKVGAVFERSPAQEAVGAELGARIAAQGGVALLVDYGRGLPGPGDTLQALAGHRKVDPLADPGRADLTVHVDFPAVLAAAKAAGAEAGIITQGDFLRKLGIAARAEALARTHPERAAQIGRQLARLTAADQMGELFKVAALWRGPAPAPFEPL